MIRLEHVSKLYRTVIGVNDVELELKEAAYGLIGPNGSGKTTMINLITGNLRPTLGRVRIFDRNPWLDRRVLHRIGLCPASDLLCPTVSALEWVSYLLAIGGFSNKEARRRAEESLQRVGMQSAMRDSIGTYSLGMRQRTKIAQAIAHDPQWLILDEPFNGLDPVGRHELSLLIRQWSHQGRGLILASHVLHEVEAVTNSFLLIHGGRVLASGSSNEVQAMLADYPQEIVLEGEGLDRVAAMIAEQAWITSLKYSNDRKSLSVGVREPKVFLEQMVQVATQPGVVITSILAADGNLSTAFDSLLRAHRGDIEC